MSRTIKQGDNYPSLKGEASDENGVVDLTLAESMVVFIKSGSDLITGVPTAIDPPETDADGIHLWNWKYDFEAGDTTVTGDYKVELEVTWTTSPSRIQTFPNHGTETMTIEASLDGS